MEFAGLSSVDAGTTRGFNSEPPELKESLLPSLTTLRINNCKKLASWITSRGLQSEGLTYLSLEHWNEVKWFPREACLPSSLQSLQLLHFSNLETLDFEGLHHLTSLQQLTIEECPKLENFTEERLPASMEKLYIRGQCPLRSKLEEMNGLGSNSKQVLGLPKTLEASIKQLLIQFEERIIQHIAAAALIQNRSSFLAHRSTVSATNREGIYPNERYSTTHSSTMNEDVARPSDLQSFSDSLKSKFNAMSLRYIFLGSNSPGTFSAGSDSN
ncbi:hypothetical protein PIB30_051742 [Stylosanthes scabra]|uniref:Uncharacterized protein n=1 Tax=Stylosanthes scabra TaxID=79078 RepID=A0ABU6TIX0_9FABA|nr:hypothetical protein [Stylosanthes scabra]